MKKPDDNSVENFRKSRDAVGAGRILFLLLAMFAVIPISFIYLKYIDTSSYYILLIELFVVSVVLAIIALAFARAAKKYWSTITVSQSSHEDDEAPVRGSVEFSKSRQKVLRAGPANFLFFIAANGIVLIYLVGMDLGYPLLNIILIEIVFILYIVFSYKAAISRIMQRRCDIVFECSLHEVEIPIKNIKGIYVIKLKLWGQLLFIVVERDKFLPRIFCATVVSFNMHWMNQAKEKVEEFLHDPECSGDA